MGLETRGMLHFAIVLILFHPAAGSLATMSLDLGTQYLKMGLVKQGSTMEMVLNRESRRKTPTLIGLRNDERFFSESASQLSVRYPKSVFMHIMDVIGKDESHPLVQLYKQRFNHADINANENGTLYFADGDKQYSVETLLAMILQNAKAETEAYAGQTVDDVVITIPAFLSQRERISIERAATVAGLKVLQLMHGGTAAALSWGAFHRKDIDGKKTRMLVYDMGASQTTATVVEFFPDEKKETRLRVLGTGYDRTLGGVEMTVRLRDHLAKRWEEMEKPSSPLTNSPRGMAKLMAEAERTKQVLSANSEILSQVEALHEDKNLRLHVSRDELETLLPDLVPRFTVPVDDALKMAGITMEGVDHFVLMGAATRMPLLQRTLQNHIGRDLGRFLNTDEAIAMGALFQSAHLSKGFKVKPLPVEETVLFPITATFRVGDEGGSGKEKTSSLFPFGGVYPSPNPRSIAFKSFRDDFSFTVSYGDLSHLSQKQQSELGKTLLLNVSVGDLKKANEEMKEGDEWRESKVSFSVDASGIVRVKSAEAFINRPRGAIEALKDSITGLFSKSEDEKNEGSDEISSGEKKEEKEEEKQKEDKENESEEKAKEGASFKEETPKNTTDSGEAKVSNATKPGVTVKEGVVKVKLSVERKRLDGAAHAEEDGKNTKKILEEFAKEEKARAERAAAENELEALAFDTSLILEEEHFVRATKDSERQILSKLVAETRTWLEDEAGVQTKTEEFKAKKKEITKKLDPVKKRMHERKEAPAALAILRDITSKVKELLANVTSVDEDLSAELNKTGEEIEKWVGEMQKEVPENEDLPYSSLEVALKEQRLREAAKSMKRKIDKRRKEEEKARKKEEEKAEEERKAAEKLKEEAEGGDEKKEEKEKVEEIVEEKKVEEGETNNDEHKEL